ncbi:hypothetical protein TorRG33x02_041580 [Trema orientale]|uniref:Uncharacterized protein n=1 Tax=Trema orientale TaxID=63057 RepID=A0A2P5FQK6_TREOI|nr:hypothetical protein TorRG33x02_041580 [Trema orientale]
MWVSLKPTFHHCTMDRRTSLTCRKLGTSAKHEIERVIIRGKTVSRAENPVVKVKAVLRGGASGVSSDHGVESEERWGLVVAQNLVRIVEISGVAKGYGGDELAQQDTVVKMTVN